MRLARREESDDNAADATPFSNHLVNGQRRGCPQRAAGARHRGALGDDRTTPLHKPTICGAPQYIAEELLRAEGFTDIRYTKIASSAEVNDAVMHGRADFDAHFAPQWASAIDGGGAISVLAGVHVGCFELFGNDRVSSISDLKGKSVGVTGAGSSDQLFLAVMARISGSTRSTTSTG